MNDKKTSWIGQFQEKQRGDLDRLAKSIDSPFLESKNSDGKSQFVFKDLSEDKSLYLVSTIRKYGLSVNTDSILSGRIKENFEDQLKHKK